MKKLIRQIIYFVGTSGIGWLIDFFLYMLLGSIFFMEVRTANMMSALTAANFVFFVSIKKNFENHQDGLKVWQKYLIYILYQTVLIGCVSWIGQAIYDYANGIEIFSGYVNLVKFGVKVCITPVTMLVNFIVMKVLVEKF